MDIFDLMKKADSTDIGYFNSLSISERKSISFYLIQRWMSGTSNKQQILFLNHFLNDKLYKLNSDQDLVYKLLCVSSTGPKRYRWIPRIKKQPNSMKLDLVLEYYDVGLNQAKDYLPILSNDDVLDIAQELGKDKEFITKLKKELN